jgi:hypothetical protein
MSRKRHSGRPSQPARPYRSVVSQMTVDDHVAVEEASAAELRGDWSAALARHRSVPMFSESEHGGDLAMLARLDDDAPGWLVDRFVTSMAHRLEAYGQPQRGNRVLQTLVPMLYPGPIDMQVIGCEHPEQVGSRIYGRDWVVRQADVHDLGGLEDLLVHPGADGLLARSDRVEDWAEAPMGGWRVEHADGDVLVVSDAATGDEVRLLDLGLTVRIEPATHVLGRVVPTTAGPGLLFDWCPLPVDEPIARAVAEAPERWLRTIAHAVREGALRPGFAHVAPTGPSADLPRHAWADLLGHGADGYLPRPPRTLAPDALAAALDLASAPDGRDVVRRRRHVISELLLDEAVDDRALAPFATVERAAAWDVLAEVLPAHAAQRCHEALWLASVDQTGEAG